LGDVGSEGSDEKKAVEWMLKKYDARKSDWNCFGIGYETVVGSCEHNSKWLAFIKGAGYFDWLMTIGFSTTLLNGVS
jgi:hypothetical protein